MSRYRATPADGVAWVTGASSGIGRAVALELARRGYLVAATARRKDELEALAEEAGGLPGKIRACACDVLDVAALASLVASIESGIGPIALGFLNVGVFYVDAGEEIGGDAFRDTFRVNFEGTVNCLRPLIAAMRARHRGQIAINSSVAGYGGLPRGAAYGASKAALIHLAQSLKFALAADGIAVQLVTPGFVKTPLTDRNRFPMPFLVPVEEAARRICDGFRKSSFEITFPRRLSWLIKAVNHLPYALYFPLVAWATGARAKLGKDP